MFEMLAVDVPLGPTDSSNASVLLWAVIILTGVVAAGWAYLSSKIKANEEKCAEDKRKCDEDRDQYRETASGHHKALVAVYQKIVEDKEEASKTKAQLLAETVRVLDRNSTIMEKLFDKDHRK